MYGQEFANFSWSILNDLEKSTEYYLRVTAFSLAGDGWPSEEILNSTMDDGTSNFCCNFHVTPNFCSCIGLIDPVLLQKKSKPN